MPTGPHDRLRGPTPRPTGEYGPTQPSRQSLPAELSQLNEILREALSDVLSQRTASGESMIAARVKVDTQRATRNLKGIAGGLGAVLVAVASWAWGQVQSYGDARVAAAEAEAKATAAHDRLETAESKSETNSRRLDTLEPKIDDISHRLDIVIGQLAAREDPNRVDAKQERRPRGR